MPNTSTTVLIIEDERSLREALSLAFIQKGFKAITASDGEAGLSLALKKHPNLIMLDIMLPKMDGMEVLKNLRQDAWGGKVPVILLTNMPADDRIIKQIVTDKPTYYLIKSDWTLEDILRKAGQALQK